MAHDTRSQHNQQAVASSIHTEMRVSGISGLHGMTVREFEIFPHNLFKLTFEKKNDTKSSTLTDLRGTATLEIKVSREKNCEDF